LAREEAAAYLSISPTKFDELVHDGRMPAPMQLDGRVIWHRLEILAAFERLPRRAANCHGSDPWASQCA
jgi:excisionase family DNA binding protein